jgi:predicted nucleic acid-binding protein
VYDWLANQPTESIFLTSVTEAELHYGVQLLPDGRRKQDLGAALGLVLEVEFRRRLLPFDSSAALQFG